MVPRAHRLQSELPMTIPTLLRNERAMAIAIVLALHMHLGDEESAEQVIQFLAQRGAAIDALFGNAAAVIQPDQQQQQALL
jgi:hypothetical protein